MSIQIGLYDFFAYTLPGFLCLSVLGYAGASLGLFQFSFQVFNTLSTPFVLASLAVSYIIGMFLEPIAKRWYRLLQPKSKKTDIFHEFKTRHPDWEINVCPEDAGLMRAYIKQQKIELALDIEKLGATNKMLLNFSLGFAALAVISLLLLFINGFQFLQLVILLVAAGLSVVAASEAAKFDRWFHYLTLESMATFSLNPSDQVIHKGSKSIRSYSKETKGTSEG
ncbi:MAG: hypothetical protein AAF152_01770 [Cyanobacteria bacterium P01_A01_bin.114]